MIPPIENPLDKLLYQLIKKLTYPLQQCKHLSGLYLILL